MRKDSKLSRMLHVLLHMAREKKPFTSEQISIMLDTNPVVVRRTMSGLKKAGFVHADKGPGGGWTLVQALEQISLFDIYLLFFSFIFSLFVIISYLYFGLISYFFYYK